MSLFGVFLLAIGVAMDAFAVSICKGITIKENLIKKAIVIAIWFGVFQWIMPLIGYFMIDVVNNYLLGVKEYIIFGLLSYVGVSMIIGAFKNEEFNSSTKFKEMFILAVATSLDALSVGMTVSLLGINVYIATLIILIVTFSFCFFGVIIGSKFGGKYRNKAELVGGIILIIIGIKVLIEYLLN